jgi:hypothetical protein
LISNSLDHDFSTDFGSIDRSTSISSASRFSPIKKSLKTLHINKNDDDLSTKSTNFNSSSLFSTNTLSLGTILDNTKQFIPNSSHDPLDLISSLYTNPSKNNDKTKKSCSTPIRKILNDNEFIRIEPIVLCNKFAKTEPKKKAIIYDNNFKTKKAEQRAPTKIDHKDNDSHRTASNRSKSCEYVLKNNESENETDPNENKRIKSNRFSINIQKSPTVQQQIVDVKIKYTQIVNNNHNVIKDYQQENKNNYNRLSHNKSIKLRDATNTIHNNNNNSIYNNNSEKLAAKFSISSKDSNEPEWKELAMKKHSAW